jgi:hypothetical protein
MAWHPIFSFAVVPLWSCYPAERATGDPLILSEWIISFTSCFVGFKPVTVRFLPLVSSPAIQDLGNMATVRIARWEDPRYEYGEALDLYHRGLLPCVQHLLYSPVSRRVRADGRATCFHVKAAVPFTAGLKVHTIEMRFGCRPRSRP